MQEELIKSQAHYSFCLDGDNEMDAVLLSKTISDMAELTKIAASEENPEAYLKMNVTAFRNGSFIIDFSAICEMRETLVISATAAVAFAAGITTVVRGIFAAKKHLAGKKPKSISDAPDGKIEVENEDGVKITIPKASHVVITNIKVDQLTMNISEYAKEHNPSGGFTISTPTGDLSCSPEDIKNISKPFPIIDEETNQRYRKNAILPIKKVDFIGSSAWQFIYEDHIISASIADDDWLNAVDNGYIQIQARDSINVTLEIFNSLDLLGNVIIGSEKYTVIKVHGGIIREHIQIDISEE